MGSCKDIKFLYLNARSIINKMDEFRVTVDGLNPDVIGITRILGFRRNFGSGVSCNWLYMF